jgi:dipeptidyl aminopeptidase/acylaminoacyl peptidase
MRETLLRLLTALSMLAATWPACAEPVSLPPYESVDDLEKYASLPEYRAAVADKRFVLERVSYPSGELEVYAYVYRPAEPSGTLPVIIFNRGSWTWPNFHAELVTMANRLARAGYVVVAPMYRGSGGAAGRDEMGGADLSDLFNLVPTIQSLPYADSTRMYLYGESRGGMMVYQALRDGFPARAAAVVGAFTDLEAMLRDDRWAKAGAVIWPDLASKKDAIVERRSAQRWADRISKPMLLIHGARDDDVPVAHALDMANKLAAADKPFQLLVVEGEGHTIRGRSADRDAWVVDWFRRH